MIRFFKVFRLFFLPLFYKVANFMEEDNFLGAAGSDRDDDKDKESEVPKDPDDIDREKLLEDFLSEVEDNDDSNESSGTGNLPELYNLKPEDYPEVDTPDDIKDKINQLKLIADAIERKKTTLEYSEEQLTHGNFKIDYVNQLNENQLNAVTTLKGPLLVIAGAGSGKTRVIVYRVSYLLENNIDPRQILLLTFTRKAAHEMISRVEELLQDNRGSKVMGGTFHSFATYVLRRYANLLNISNNFTIIDTADSEDTIDLVRTELKFNQKDKKFPKKKRLQKIISGSRNRNITIREFIEKYYTGLIDYIQDIELIYNGYNRYKKASNLFDFDDLMDFLRDALRDNYRFRHKLQNDFRYIMVDEFQDTNVVQKEIVDLLAGKHRNIMVVGDDSQSIYAFRGANYENILRFPQQYPECKVVKIEQNYRSNQNLLSFTNSIVDNAIIGYKKQLYSDIESYAYPEIR
ncbi:MAG: ATP-dependent helicase, partial [Bacteroidota bacterium]